MDPADASPQPDSSPAVAQPLTEASAAAGSAHNFDVQKELHRQIRNDPDYDDWEYGTEPLPKEAWVANTQTEPTAAAGEAAPLG
jgi:hypothetical protein